MRVEVTRIQDEAEDVRSFELRAVDGGELPTAEAGSHIRVEITLDGSVTERHYSIVSGEGDRSRYEIAVLREDVGRGGSAFLHEKVKEGDILEISPPRNDFPLGEGDGHNILIAGGIGITAILAMLRQLETVAASFEVHYAAKSRARMAYADEVKRLAGDRGFLYASDDGPTGSRMDLEGLLSTPLEDAHVYVCGPQRLIEAVKRRAGEAGWSSEQIHFEAFGAYRRPADRDLEVELAYTGSTLVVRSNQTILDVLLNAGVWAPFECRRGECGMCVTQVLGGEPDHRDVCLSEGEREQSMCTCVSRAKGSKLVLAL